MRFHDIPDLTEKDKERFFSNLAVADKNKCWEWQANTDGRYGKMSVKGQEYKAHRLAYFVFNDVKPSPDKDVCHSCDNPPCCNPNHLFEGTRQENLLDCLRKGRKISNPKYGDNNPSVKLSDKKVYQIRAIYSVGIFGTHELAKHFNVARSLIHRIIDGKSRAINQPHINGFKKYDANRVKFYLQAVHPNTQVQVVKNSKALKEAGYTNWHYGYSLYFGFKQYNYMTVRELKQAWKLTDEMVNGHALNWLKAVMET